MKNKPPSRKPKPPKDTARSLKIWIAADLYGRAQAAADRDGRSLSNWARRHIEQALAS